MKNKKIIGYTAGAFDLFHLGHLNIIKKAKNKCDYLIVGVTTDELIKETKGKHPFIPLNERLEILQSIKYIDEVIIQDDLDKIKAWETYEYDILFSGSDWESSSRWQRYIIELKKVNVEVVFFPYTKTTSSTQIQKLIKKRAI